MRTQLRLPAIIVIAALHGPAFASPVLHEPFEYPVPNGDPHVTLDAIDGGIGFEGPWSSTASATGAEFHVNSTSLGFEGLSVSGGTAGRYASSSNLARGVRTLSESSKSTLLADQRTVWFGMLLRVRSSGSQIADFSFILGDTGHNTATGSANNPRLTAAGNGLGLHLQETSLYATKYVNSTTQTRSPDFLPISPGTTYLIAGRIDWGENGAGHKLSLFNITDPTAPEPQPSAAFSTSTADFNQSLFDLITFLDRPDRYTEIDEIRFATSFKSAIGVVPPPTFPLTIQPAAPPATGFQLEWQSLPGNLYNLRTSTDLAQPLTQWELVAGDIPATPSLNVFLVQPDGPSRFYAVEEFAAPPPPPLFTRNFDDDDGGFTPGPSAGSPWAHGQPDSEDAGGGFAVKTGNDGSPGAWGVNLTGTYLPGTNASLRSPVIDLDGITGATLTFARALDIDAGDSLVVRVIEHDSETVLGAPLLSLSGPVSSNWPGLASFALPPEALDRPVRIEWAFVGTNNSSQYLGVYIDDVSITRTAP